MGYQPCLRPASANNVYETILVKPKGFEAESIGSRGVVILRGEEQRNMVRANPGDSPKGSEGASEFPLRRDQDAVQDGAARVCLAIGLGLPGTNPI